VWEYELVPAPQLLTVHQNGKAVDVVAQASKSGFLYVLDRVTGKPVWPIEEKPVPKSDMPGEQLSPTQPFPTKPPAYERQSYTAKDIDKLILTDAERKRWTDILSKARNDGMFTPFSTEYYTIQMPGHSGGANLFGTSSDLETGTTYVISYTQPALERYYSTASEAAKYIGHTLYGPDIASGDPVDMKQLIRRPGDTGRGGGGRGTTPGGDPVAQQGRAMYEQVCQQCHGANLTPPMAELPLWWGL
jgi:quinoprotein glucose dehydrogenase